MQESIRFSLDEKDSKNEYDEYLKNNIISDRVSKWKECHKKLGVGYSDITQENIVSIQLTQNNSCLISNLLEDEELKKIKILRLHYI